MAAAHLLPPNLPVSRQALQYLTLCFAFFPGWIALLLGQTATVLLLILTLIFISFERGENLNTAFCLDSTRATFPQRRASSGRVWAGSSRLLGVMDSSRCCACRSSGCLIGAGSAREREGTGILAPWHLPSLQVSISTITI